MTKRWRQSLGILVGCFIYITLLSGCQSLPKPVFEPQGDCLRLVTYNVNWGGNPQRVTHFLEVIDADIICLQETHPQWENYFKNHLSITYPYTVFHHSRGAGGIAFMSKYPLKDQQVIKSEAGWFPAFYIQAATPLGDVGILNVHLKPPLSDEGRVSAYAMLNTPAVHLEELQHFMRTVSPEIPVIVTGDFNENESGRACQWLNEQGYSDALSGFDRKTPTWLWPTKIGFVLKDRYDHIYIKESFVCTGAKVFSVRASDHEPVLAVLQKNEPVALQQP
ncbi:MAG: endonuclease/exonuclease/phosphatase family protein [Planctomycetota bacterium]|jgi:endonuclease/exonuclease/phosphatase family metal-dependent hydrolase